MIELVPMLGAFARVLQEQDVEATVVVEIKQGTPGTDGLWHEEFVGRTGIMNETESNLTRCIAKPGFIAAGFGGKFGTTSTSKASRCNPATNADEQETTTEA